MLTQIDDEIHTNDEMNECMENVEDVIKDVDSDVVGIDNEPSFKIYLFKNVRCDSPDFLLIRIRPGFN